MTREQVLTKAASMAVEVNAERYSDGSFLIELVAPDGFRFYASDAHISNTHREWWDDTPAVELWKSAMEDLEYGLLPCDTDCDCQQVSA